ncbi:MAG: hypothetical protein ACXWQR_06605 [Ktedonobacterales bacterium]
MRKSVPLLLLASQGLALCAVVAGLGAGLLATFAAAFTCFDTCPTRKDYFSLLGPASLRVMTPCVVIELLALAAFLAHCVATRQARRAVTSILLLLVGGMAGVAALSALMQHGQATLPVIEDDVLAESQVESWAQLWGLALMLVAGAWSGILAYQTWSLRNNLEAS